MQDAWRAYLELALGLTETSRKKATKAVQRLIGKGGATAEQLQSLAEDLAKTSAGNREAITKLVRYELDRALGAVGLATDAEVAELTARVNDLERQLQEMEIRLAMIAPEPLDGMVADTVLADRAAANQLAADQRSADAVVPPMGVAEPDVTQSGVAGPDVTQSGVGWPGMTEPGVAGPDVAGPPAKKAIAKKAATKQAVAKKAVAKKAVAEKAVAKKAIAKKAVAKKAPGKKAAGPAGDGTR